MSKIIKLLESDLVKIVKQVLSEKIINEETYVIRPGDSLSKIAKRFGVSVKDIANQNNISDINKIRVGATLKINAGGQSTQTSNTQSTETNANKNYIKSFDFNSLWRNFPRGTKGTDIFPVIMPEQYKERPGEFQNACATRLSLALNNVGIRPDSKYRTQQDFTWNGVKYKKGLPVTTTAIDTPPYLNRKLGPPTFKMENTTENINKFLKGKKAIFVLTGVPGWRATGHADITDFSSGQPTCGHSCYFGAGGTIRAWVFA